MADLVADNNGDDDDDDNENGDDLYGDNDDNLDNVLCLIMTSKIW